MGCEVFVLTFKLYMYINNLFYFYKAHTINRMWYTVIVFVLAVLKNRNKSWYFCFTYALLTLDWLTHLFRTLILLDKLR